MKSMTDRMKATVERLYFPLLGCLSLGALMTIGAAHGVAGLRVNLTPSIPRGVYWYVPGSVHRGDLVQACLPLPLAVYAKARHMLGEGSCPAQSEPIVKVLAAVRGDTVVLRRGEIRINGTAWPMSASRLMDAHGRRVDFRLIPGVYVVSATSAFLLGLHPRSWDSRYFGSLPMSAVSGRWYPLVTERGICS
jgi:conjugative transfer signal peptidase TraF